VTNGAITKEVAEFLSRYVDSVAHLELLLVLYESNPKQWSASDVARELRVEPAWAAARLKDFSKGGIVREESTDVYRYAPKNESLRQVVQAVANAYSERRVAVTDFIYSKPLANLRVFAESFRIRDKQSDKDDKDG
jgi:hypothetical protein